MQKRVPSHITFSNDGIHQYKYENGEVIDKPVMSWTVQNIRKLPNGNNIIGIDELTGNINAEPT
jgi:hypothetical protein